MGIEKYLLLKAYDFALAYHQGQRYGKKAYIEHLLDVQERVKKAGFDEKYQIVAILHDVLEDTVATENELRVVFGGEITEAVKVMTNTLGKERYLEYVAIVKQHEIAKVVKFFDIMSNLENCFTNSDYSPLVSKYLNALHILL